MASSGPESGARVRGPSSVSEFGVRVRGPSSGPARQPWCMPEQRLRRSGAKPARVTEFRGPAAVKGHRAVLTGASCFEAGRLTPIDASAKSEGIAAELSQPASAAEECRGAAAMISSDHVRVSPSSRVKRLRGEGVEARSEQVTPARRERWPVTLCKGVFTSPLQSTYSSAQQREIAF